MDHLTGAPFALEPHARSELHLERLYAIIAY